MRVKHLPTLPQWQQGDDHWVLLKLPSWLRLPTWTVAQAAAIINDEDPESNSTDTLELLDGRSISRFTTNEKEKNYLQVFSRNKEAFMVHANAHKKVEASPAGWLLFAEEIVGISPEWKQLAIDKGLLPSTDESEKLLTPIDNAVPLTAAEHATPDAAKGTKINSNDVPQDKKQERQDALTVELYEILDGMTKFTPSHVMAKLRDKIGKPNTCILSNMGDAIQWERNNGNVETLNIAALGERISNWKDKKNTG